MNSQEYLDLMKDIYEKILNFLEEEDKLGDNFLILENKFTNSKISENKYIFLSLLHLISKICNNHHRFPNFFFKIEKILQIFKEDIKKYFSNFEIFNIFKNNKRILLYLIEEQIMLIDENIVRKFTKVGKYIKAKYPQYFQSEIQPFINEKWFPKSNNNGWVEDIKKELPDNFYEKRKEGENDSQLSEFIRNDMITEFVIYINQNNISPNSKIQPSNYETNPFLLKNQKQNNDSECGFSLIEYAVFFGSIQIFNHLRFVGTELTASLWSLAIHGQNAEIIHILEENHVEMKDNSYKEVFYESIKCHHNDIANYFKNNFLENNEEKSDFTVNQIFKCYNFTFLKDEFINKSSFCKMCNYDYCSLVDNFLKSKIVDINKKEIFYFLFFKYNFILLIFDYIEIISFNKIQNSIIQWNL